jgi:hypothetical protein
VSKKILAKLVSGTLVAVVVAGSAFLMSELANAAPPAGTLGTLTITPATGTDITAMSAGTSAPCPETADSSVMFITGPVGAVTQTFPPDDPFPIVTTTKASFSTIDDFELPFGLTLKDAATDRSTTLATGEYDLTAKCVKGLTQESFGTFTGAIYFTNSTTYQANDPAAGTPTPTPGTSSTTSATTTPTDTTTTEPTDTTDTTTPDTTTTMPGTTSDSDTTTWAAGGGGGGANPSPDQSSGAPTSSGILARTGSPVGLIFLLGLILLVAGLILVFVFQRRKSALADQDGETGTTGIDASGPMH